MSDVKSTTLAATVLSTAQSDRFRLQVKILASMYIGYGAMMVSRQIVTILSPALLADASLGLTKTNIGDFLAYGTIGALVGKIIWGPLVDRIGGRLTIFIGISLTALLVAGFGLSANVMSFTVLSFLLYCTKSSGWPGMTKLVGHWYHPHKYGRVWGILSTSSRASVILGTLFFGWLLSQMSWRVVAFISTGVALLIAAVCQRTLKDKPEDPEFLNYETETENLEVVTSSNDERNDHPLQMFTLVQSLFVFAKSLRVWLVIVMLMLLTCLMAFLDFVPVYLMEVFKLTPSKASMASSVFPVGSLTGLLLSAAFYDRYSKKGLRRVLTIALAGATACVLLLRFLPNLNLNPEQNFLVALIMILSFGLMISPAYYIPMSIFSIEFGGPFSATLICLIDAFGFAASASFGFIGGRLADGAGGWASFMNMLILLSVIATASVWMFMHREYKASIKQPAH